VETAAESMRDVAALKVGIELRSSHAVGSVYTRNGYHPVINCRGVGIPAVSVDI
jgi:hypothetical protein